MTARTDFMPTVDADKTPIGIADVLLFPVLFAHPTVGRAENARALVAGRLFAPLDLTEFWLPSRGRIVSFARLAGEVVPPRMLAFSAFFPVGHPSSGAVRALHRYLNPFFFVLVILHVFTFLSTPFLQALAFSFRKACPKRYGTWWRICSWRRCSKCRTER